MKEQGKRKIQDDWEINNEEEEVVGDQEDPQQQLENAEGAEEEENIDEGQLDEDEEKEDGQGQLDGEEARAIEYREMQDNRGVCYLSRIPPYMKPNYIRKLLSSYNIERIYLLPESEWTRKNRIKRGGNKKVCFREGWVEFADKRMAKMAALTLNGQKMVAKKGNFYSEDLWNLKYLPKFRWHHLTQRLAHQERLKRERLKVELQIQRKTEDFYAHQFSKSKMINGIVVRKQKKGQKTENQRANRNFHQISMAPQIQEQ